MSSDGTAPALSRRALLGGALATAALGLGGCRAGSTDAAPTVASLRAQQPFYIAHRGGGGDWPEMTAYAYEQAAKLPGLKALEISVCISSDGVLVCSHDPTTTRMTGVNLTIGHETWATLSELRTSAKDTTNPGQPSQPLARLDELLDRYADDFVLFVEPKVPAAEGPLLIRLGSVSPSRIVWKQPLTSNRFVEARTVGFATWGYVLDSPGFLGANLTRLAAEPSIDMLGFPVRGPAPVLASIRTAASNNGKQSIAWPLSVEADRARALEFGASGLMTSNVTELVPGG